MNQRSIALDPDPLMHRIINGLLIVGGILAIGLTAMNVLRRDTTSSRYVHDWKAFIPAGTTVGSGGAPVRVIVFSDYQCPLCERLAIALDRFDREFPNLVETVWRHYPLRGHAYARPAAAIAICAAQQGAFTEVHHLLFRHVRTASGSSWLHWSDLGQVDSSTMAVCLGSDLPDSILLRDYHDAATLGARGTPTVLIESQLYVGIPSNLRGILLSLGSRER